MKRFFDSAAPSAASTAGTIVMTVEGLQIVLAHHLLPVSAYFYDRNCKCQEMGQENGFRVDRACCSAHVLQLSIDGWSCWTESATHRCSRHCSFAVAIQLKEGNLKSLQNISGCLIWPVTTIAAVINSIRALSRIQYSSCPTRASYDTSYLNRNLQLTGVRSVSVSIFAHNEYTNRLCSATKSRRQELTCSLRLV